MLVELIGLLPSLNVDNNKKEPGDYMQTVKEIEMLLKDLEQPSDWLKELESDKRAGVQKALKRWYKNEEKRQRIRFAHEEKKAFDASYKPFSGAYVAGVDEAGRGPLAGPVVTASVILPDECDELIGLDDSKTITKDKREQLADIIRTVAIDYAVHIQPASVIDDINIYEATRQSMEASVNQLSIAPHFVMVDAMKLSIPQQTASITKADAQSLAVAAASILAKTTRDQYMDRLHEEYPMYQFQKNAGYGTVDHIEALKKHGPTSHHRKTFEPVKSLVKK